jgi:hypothetical protein
VPALWRRRWRCQGMCLACKLICDVRESKCQCLVWAHACDPQVVTLMPAQHLQRWQLNAPGMAASTSRLPSRGTRLICAECQGEPVCTCSVERAIRISEPTLPGHPDAHPMIKGMDWHHTQQHDELLIGTSGCDIWAITGQGTEQQRAILDGHSAGVTMVAVHPGQSHKFVSADDTGSVLRYNAESRLLECRTVLAFKCQSIAVSSASPTAMLVMP